MVWDNTTLTYNGKEQAPTASVAATDLCGTDTCEITVSGAKTTVGSGYSASAIGSNSNYELQGTNTVFKIQPKALTVTAKDTTIFSGEEIPADAIAFDGLVKGEELQVSITSDYSADDAYDANNTEFTMTPVVTEDSASKNYTITYVSGTLTVEPVVYKYKDGSKEAKTLSLTYTKSSNKDVTFTSAGEYEDFVAFYLDGIKVDSANYTVKESSPTVLTLKSSYLDTLSTGKHTVKFEFKHGATEEGTLTIKEQTKAAKTGDSATPALWALLCVLSVTGLGYTATRRKHN